MVLEINSTKHAQNLADIPASCAGASQDRVSPCAAAWVASEMSLRVSGLTSGHRNSDHRVGRRPVEAGTLCDKNECVVAWTRKTATSGAPEDFVNDLAAAYRRYGTDDERMQKAKIPTSDHSANDSSIPDSWFGEL